MIRFACPACKKILKAPPDAAGRKTSCHRCRLPLVVPGPVPVPAGPSAAVRPPGPDPATVVVACPGCRRKIPLAPADLSLPFIECGRCDTRFVPGEFAAGRGPADDPVYADTV